MYLSYQETIRYMNPYIAIIHLNLYPYTFLRVKIGIFLVILYHLEWTACTNNCIFAGNEWCFANVRWILRCVNEVIMNNKLHFLLSGLYKKANILCLDIGVAIDLIYCWNNSDGVTEFDKSQTTISSRYIKTSKSIYKVIETSVEMTAVKRVPIQNCTFYWNTVI